MGIFGNNGKKKIAIEIDENVYNAFVNSIEEKDFNDAIEDAMRDYIFSKNTIDIPDPEPTSCSQHYSNLSDIELIAYCFSNYEHTSLYPMLNQTEAFAEAAKTLGVKVNTLKNKRDAFDGNYRDIPFDRPDMRAAIGRRLGWPKPLSILQQEIKDKYDPLSSQEVVKKALQILNGFSQNEPDCNFDNTFSKENKTIEEFQKDGLDALLQKWLRKKTAPYNVMKAYFVLSSDGKTVNKNIMQRYAFNELCENNFQTTFCFMKNGGNHVSEYSIFDLKYGEIVVLADDVKETVEKYRQEFLK